MSTTATTLIAVMLAQQAKLARHFRDAGATSAEHALRRDASPPHLLGAIDALLARGVLHDDGRGGLFLDEAAWRASQRVRVSRLGLGLLVAALVVAGVAIATIGLMRA